MSARHQRGAWAATAGTARGSRSVAATAVAAVLGALVLAGVNLPTAAAAGEEATDAPAFSETATLTREFQTADGTRDFSESKKVTVNVSNTQNLRGRERVLVSWSGARPSANRAPNPYGSMGYGTEYPVVIMQCRGLAEQVRPETCWTASHLQRNQDTNNGFALWRNDLRALPADKADHTEESSWPMGCLWSPPSTTSLRLVPFESAAGKIYQFCNLETVSPEAGDLGGFPPAEIAAFTNLQGDGAVQFEVRTDVENGSLGCSSSVPCSLVVIPIMGLSCIDGADSVRNKGCRGQGVAEPGSIDLLGGGRDEAVAARYWWSASNWNQKFVIPLNFALPPNACDVIDKRAPVGFYGSELLAQASLQWAPAYCLRQDRFKFQHNRMAEPVALRLLDSGGAVAALVSDPPEVSDPPKPPPPIPVAYAPVAVTGFAVAFVSDLPENAGEAKRLRLTPRLLLKLLSQSYTGSRAGRLREGLEQNPLAISLDPEFIELNAGLSRVEREALATVLSLSESSDVLHAATEYIAADPEARAFLDGAPDPWGMRIHPAYRGLELPRAEWPMLDTFVAPSAQDCEKKNRTPYFTKIAAPVPTLRRVAEAMLDAWPNVQLRCDSGQLGAPDKIGRIGRQDFGNRFMLGLVTLGDAERFGLRTAELRTAGEGPGATFVAAGTASMAAAVGAASQSAPGQPFGIDRQTLRSDRPEAYPGTMIVHAAAKLSGLPSADASHIAQFVRTATTEGQVVGPNNGELPRGFLPLVDAGATAPLFASAQLVASAFERQSGALEAPPIASTPPAAAPRSSTDSSGSAPAQPPRPGRAPAPAPALAGVESVLGQPAPAAPPAVALPATSATPAARSTAPGMVIPAALGLGLAGAFLAPALRALSVRRRPE